MDRTLAAMLSTWSLDAWLTVPLVLTGAIYLRGWWTLKRRGATRFNSQRLAMFGGGLAAVYVALASPIDAYSPLLLQLHMVQHLLLIVVAAPLIWLGEPQLPLLVGLPAAVRDVWVAPLLRWQPARSLAAALTRLPVAWALHFGMVWAWHLPQLYELALRSTTWHYVEHACFFATALLFWWPVVQPYPSQPREERWTLLPYLFLAGVQGTVLSALLTFSDRVVYPSYAQAPRLWGLSALDDQRLAGAIMWVPGSLAYLIPLVVIGAEVLYGLPRRRLSLAVAGASSFSNSSIVPTVAARSASSSSLLPILDQPAVRAVEPATAHRSLDLLRVPLLGPVLGSRPAQRMLQTALLLAAGAMVVDGFIGPRTSALNLAGVLPWIHWRGVVVLALLALGNVFCMACPFTLPRSLARRWLPVGWNWPRMLRSKWLAVALLVLFFWAYEVFSLWDSPWWTAWIIVGYFVAAAAIDGLFRGSAFCKYVCPIGQFNFVQALVSPFEVRVRDANVCAGCTTHECIRGSDRVEGCGLALFQPRKVSNFDCTFCLDCAHACPHQNVGVLTTLPGGAILEDRYGSGIGRLGRRADVAALVAVLVFAAFVNAAGMTSPVIDAQDRIATSLGLARRTATVTGSILLGIVVVPLALVSMAAVGSERLDARREGRRDIALRYVYSLVPLGLGMWLAHYTFHLWTSYDAIVPAATRFVGDLRGEPMLLKAAACNCAAGASDWLLKLEILMLDVGLLASLYLAWRVALRKNAPPRKALAAVAPWAALQGVLFAVGLWILFQPMQMRGTMEMP